MAADEMIPTSNNRRVDLDAKIANIFRQADDRPSVIELVIVKWVTKSYY